MTDSTDDVDWYPGDEEPNMFYVVLESVEETKTVSCVTNDVKHARKKLLEIARKNELDVCGKTVKLVMEGKITGLGDGEDYKVELLPWEG